MRVGLQLEGTTCRSAVLDGHRILFTDNGSAAASLAEALDRSLAALRTAFGPQVTGITADVGSVLRTRTLAEVIAIRISPRPPADAFHEIRLPPAVAQAVARTVHVRGGHDMRGRVLAPLDLEGFLREVPGLLSGTSRSVAITAVG